MAFSVAIGRYDRPNGKDGTVFPCVRLQNSSYTGNVDGFVGARP